MSKNIQKMRENKISYLGNLTNSYSHNQMALPYNYQVESENCLRQFLNIVERRLKKE